MSKNIQSKPRKVSHRLNLLLFTMKKLLTTVAVILSMMPASAQRITDKIDRGIVAVPAASGGGNLISWRVLGEEYYDVTYNLYCNGALLAKELKVSNYQHDAGKASDQYQVAAVVKGVEQKKSAAVTRWTNGCLTIPVQRIIGRDGTDVTSHYTINDISLGDLDGDGVVEFIAKRPCDIAADVSQKNAFHVLDAYDRFGKRLWWIDLGPNMLSGADEQWDCVCYDWDMDGKAEVLLRLQDNAIIHYADGTTLTIGDSNVDTRWSGIEYTSTGNEYLVYLEGATGKPYPIGDSNHPNYMNYPLTRGTDTDWGSGIVGHRSTKHYFGAPYLDGHKPSIFLGRGAYTKHKMMALDVDSATHALTTRWAWENSTSGSPWFGQGYHNFAIGDVDWDGRDEIIFGSMVIDDNGKGLSTTGLGHGDAQHCSDFDPYRKYEEQFACNETSPANNYRNAVTSELYYRLSGGGDDGRCLMANFTNDYPGSVGRSVGSGWVSSTSDKIISELNGDSFISWGDLNQRIYWDGDLLDEYFDSPGTEGYGAIYKPASKTTTAGRWNFPDSKCSNWSKNNPGAIADIFGDWREELVMRKADNSAILVYSTGIPTSHRLPTLWSDHQYRNAMVWQSMGYNQPPHKSYFVGEMEGITQAPPPLTMTGRKEVSNGGTISTTADHLIVCENNDTQVKIAANASPYMVTFNVPSWVQGTAVSNTTTKKTPITYTYYKCDVTGGPLTGATRLVKQGDGILNLPKVDMTYTGETNIWAGTLNFDGTMKNSPLWLNRFAELNSDGGVFKSIKADYGSVIRPGGEGKTGSIEAIDSLTLGFGSRIVLDIKGDDIDHVSCGRLNIETKNWTYGPKYLMPVLELAGTLKAGKYEIGNVKEVVGNLSDIKIEGQGDYKTHLSLEDGKLYLSLSEVREASDITWNGNEDGTWDYANTKNFYLSSDDAKTPEVFVAQDVVRFTDEAAKKVVTINGEMDVDTIHVDNTAAYTFSGTGHIKSGAFVKEGTGMVTINNDNTYSGGNYLRGGTVRVKTLASETQAYGGLGAAQSDPKKFTIENGATLMITASAQNASPITFVGEKGGVIQPSGSLVQQKILTGTLMTKKGTGSITLAMNNTNLQKMVIEAGSIAAQSTPAKEVEMQGGTLSVASGSNCPITIASGKTAVLQYNDSRGTFSNALLGKGTVTVNYPLVAGSGWYATRATLNGDWSAFEGTIKAAVVAADGRFCINNAKGLPKGTLNLASGVIAQTDGLNYTISKVTGNGSLGGTCTYSNGYTPSANTWNVGNDANWNMDAKVTGNCNFNKIGLGIMTVKMGWDHTGFTKISEGTIKLSGSTVALGTGALTISADAALTGVTTGSACLKNSSVTINGIVQPGASATSVTGTLAFNRQNVAIGKSGALCLIIRKPSTKESPLSSTAVSGTAIKNINRLTINGTISLKLNYASGNTPAVGDTLVLWRGVNSFSGTPTIVCNDENVKFDTSLLKEGKLVITSITTGINNIPVDEQVTVMVYKTSGGQVATFKSTVATLNADINAKGIPSGIYLIKIISKEGVVTEKKAVK